MKLIIQIPCLNEEENLRAVVAELPTKISGIDQIELLVIDDGSVDQTSSLAQTLGVHHILRSEKRLGLARAFQLGVKESARLGGDILVNTDGDGQYQGGDIARLIQPILAGEADFVIGCRNIWAIQEFSLGKKLLQVIGSRWVRFFTGLPIPDATSGFRAYSRTAYRELNFVNTFTHTLETLVIARARGIRTSHIPIEVNRKSRESRLYGHVAEYVAKAAYSFIQAVVYWQLISPAQNRPRESSDPLS